MSLLRTAAYALAGALLFCAVALCIYPLQSSIELDFAADPPARLVPGLYPIEHTSQGQTFAWTRGMFGLVLPDLDRRHPWTLTLRIATSRPDGSIPTITAAVDGVSRPIKSPPAAGYADERVTIDARPDGRRGVSLAITIAPTFVPSADDQRALGAQLDWIRLEPSGRWPVSPLPWSGPIALGAIVGAIVGLLALPWRASAAMLMVGALAAGTVITRGLGPFVPIAWVPIAVATAVTTLAVFLALDRSVSARVVVGISALAVCVKLLILFHPDMPIGDALFHAHRYQDVLAGKFVFSSLAPGNYRFPYPVGLYVAAWPLSSVTGRTFNNMALLRVIVVASEAFAAALLYRLMMRWRRDEAGAIATVGFYHLLPLGFSVIVTANLTNAFAQALAMIVLVVTAGLAAGVSERQPRARVNLTAALLLLLTGAAFLSHTSTFVVLASQLALTTMVFLLSRSGDRRQVGKLVAAMLIGALVVAVVLYYRHFMDIYREAFERITAETGRATSAAGGRTPMQRLAATPQAILTYYGLPALILAAIGAVHLARHRPHESAAMIIAVWLAACLAFIAVGIVTPVDLRHGLAAVPLVAALAAVGWSTCWRAGRVGRVVATLAAVGVGWVGAASWSQRF